VGDIVERAERQAIIEALQATNGNRPRGGRAARREPATLFYKIDPVWDRVMQTSALVKHFAGFFGVLFNVLV